MQRYLKPSPDLLKWLALLVEAANDLGLDKTKNRSGEHTRRTKKSASKLA